MDRKKKSYFSAQKMVAVVFCETLVNLYQTTWHEIPESGNIYTHTHTHTLTHTHINIYLCVSVQVSLPVWADTIFRTEIK